MKKVKFAIAALAFTVAIGGAYASSQVDEIGYTSKALERPNQEQPCEQNGVCADIVGDCQVVLADGTFNLYTPSTECNILLQGPLVSQ